MEMAVVSSKNTRLVSQPVVLSSHKPVTHYSRMIVLIQSPEMINSTTDRLVNYKNPRKKKKKTL